MVVTGRWVVVTGRWVVVTGRWVVVTGRWTLGGDEWTRQPTSEDIKQHLKEVGMIGWW